MAYPFRRFNPALSRSRRVVNALGACFKRFTSSILPQQFPLRQPRRKVLFEAMEPRLLLSADIAMVSLEPVEDDLFPERSGVLEQVLVDEPAVATMSGGVVDGASPALNEEEAIRSSLESLAQQVTGVRGDLIAQARLDQDIGGTHFSINELLSMQSGTNSGLGAFLDAGQHITDFVNNPENWKSELDGESVANGLLDHLTGSWLSSLAGYDPHSGSSPLILSLQEEAGEVVGLELIFSANDNFEQQVDLNLGDGANDLRIDLSFDTGVDLLLDISTDIDLRFTAYFGDGASEASFEITNLSVDVNGGASDIVANVEVGPLQASIGNENDKGHVTFTDVGVDVTLTDGEFGFTAGGSLVADLPFYAQLGDFDFNQGASPTITLSGEIFPDQPDNAVAFATTDFEEFYNLARFDVDDIHATFESVRDWMGDLAVQPTFEHQIPFIDRSVGGIIDFAEGFAEVVLDQIDFEQVGSLQDFIDTFTNANLLPVGAQLAYNPTENTFSIPLTFNAPLAEESGLVIDFGSEFGPELSDLSTTATADLQASVAGRFELVVDLDELTASNRATWYIEDADMSGQASVVVDDLDVVARLGFLGIAAGGTGSGSRLSVDANASLELIDATTDNRRFTVADLIETGLIDKISSDVTGSAATVVKGLRVEDGFGDLGAVPDAQIGLYVQDITDLGRIQTITQDGLDPVDLQALIDDGHIAANDVVVVTPELANVFDIRNLDFETISDALNAGVDWLDGALAVTPFFHQTIPVINRSLADALDFVSVLDARIGEAVAAPVATIQQVEASIEEILGIDDDNALPADQQKFAITLADQVVTLHVQWSAVLEELFTFNLDLDNLKSLSGETDAAELLRGIDRLIDLQGAQTGGNILLEAVAEATIDVGIDYGPLATSQTSEIFIVAHDEQADIGSHVEIGAKVVGQDLDLGFAVGPMALHVVGGSAVLDLDGDAATDDRAVFTVGLAERYDVSEDSPVAFEDLTIDLLNWDLDGNFAVDLPLNLAIAEPPLELGALTVAVNDEAYGDNALKQLFLHLANSEDAGEDAPIVLDTPDIMGLFEQFGGEFSLASILNDPSFILDGLDLGLGAVQGVISSTLDVDLPVIGDKLGHVTTFIRDLRQGLLGELRETMDGRQPLELLRQAMWKVLGDIVQDSEDAGSDVTIDDIQLTWYDEQGGVIGTWQPGRPMPAGVDAIQVDVLLQDTFLSTGLDLPVEFHIPGLGLEVDGGLSAQLGWTLPLGFGLSASDGFYLVDGEGPEVAIDIDLLLDGTPADPGNVTTFSATGELLFFKAALTDNLTHSGLKGVLSLDLDGGADGRFSLDEMLSARPADVIHVDFTADTDIDLGMELELDGAVGLPKLSGNLKLDWGWQLGSPPQAPSVSITELSIDAVSLVSDFLKPIAERIANTLEPTRPIIDALTFELADLAQFFDEPNLLGIISQIQELRGKQPIDWSFVYAAEEMLDVVDTVDAMLGLNGSILLGSIHGLGTEEVTYASALDADSPVYQQLGVKEGDIRELGAGGSVAATQRAGFEFLTHITDIGNWAQLLTGGDATLFTYEMPLLEADFDFRVLLGKLPILPTPVSINIYATGGVDLQADLSFGYDTFGVLRALETDNPFLALDGFFVGDFDRFGNEKPELKLNADIGLDVALGAFLGEAGFSGALNSDGV